MKQHGKENIVSVMTDKQKCNGCDGLKEPLCVSQCPGNLLTLDSDGKSRMRCALECWDCMACVKICPNSALETRLPYLLALYKASLKPKTRPDRIEWTLIDINGEKEEFTIKTLEI